MQLSLQLALILCCCAWTSRAGRWTQPHKILKINTPYLTLYENENFRGKVHTQVIGKECSNLPEEFSRWASSIETHRRCVEACDQPNCKGHCERLEPNTGNVARLSKIGLNDGIVSVKSCYQFLIGH